MSNAFFVFDGAGYSAGLLRSAGGGLNRPGFAGGYFA
jgi:hypothetical protein